MNRLLVDAHAHYHHIPGRYQLTNGQLIENWEALLSPTESCPYRIIPSLCGTSPADWDDLIPFSSRKAMATEIPFCISIGLHPWYLSCDLASAFATLEKHLMANADLHVGEIGLDGLDRIAREFPLTHQREIFRQQWEIAYEYERAITVHCVKAWQPLYEDIKKLPRLNRGFLLHAFTGPENLIEPLAGLGAYFSFSSATLERDKVSRLLDKIPIERLLLETDAPYMPSSDGQKIQHTQTHKPANHPANLWQAYLMVLEKRRLSVDQLLQQSWHNAERLWLG